MDDKQAELDKKLKATRFGLIAGFAIIWAVTIPWSAGARPNV